MKRDRDTRIDSKLEDILDIYTIDYPTDLEREKTLNILKEYMTMGKKNYEIGNMKSILKLTLRELVSECKTQYAIMIISLLFLFPILNLSISPYVTIFFTAPIPIFIGFWTIFNKMDSCMIELEKTLKYSYYQILCARILTITYISIVFLSIYLVDIVLIGESINLLFVFKLMVSGLIPIFMFSLYMLFIASRNKHHSLFNVSLLTWGLFGFTAISTKLQEIMLNLHILIYIFILIFTIILFIMNIKKILRMGYREMMDI